MSQQRRSREASKDEGKETSTHSSGVFEVETSCLHSRSVTLWFLEFCNAPSSIHSSFGLYVVYYNSQNHSFHSTLFFFWLNVLLNMSMTELLSFERQLLATRNRWSWTRCCRRKDSNSRQLKIVVIVSTSIKLCQVRPIFVRGRRWRIVRPPLCAMVDAGSTIGLAERCRWIFGRHFDVNCWCRFVFFMHSFFVTRWSLDIVNDTESPGKDVGGNVLF